MRLFRKKSLPAEVRPAKPHAPALIESLEDRRLLSSAHYATEVILTNTANNASVGQSVTLTARVTRTNGSKVPVGSEVEFISGKHSVVATATVNKTGHASIIESTAFQGTYNLSAYFLGNGHYVASQSGRVVLTIALPTLTTSGDGLQSAVITPGTGTGVSSTGTLTVNYTGYLTNGTLFDTSLQSGRSAFQATLNSTDPTKGLIQGWDEGLTGAQVGETLLLVVPPSLAYGSSPPSGSNIPANATLEFIITVVSIP